MMAEWSALQPGMRWVSGSNPIQDKKIFVGINSQFSRFYLLSCYLFFSLRRAWL